MECGGQTALLVRSLQSPGCPLIALGLGSVDLAVWIKLLQNAFIWAFLQQELLCWPTVLYFKKIHYILKIRPVGFGKSSGRVTHKLTQCSLVIVSLRFQRSIFWNNSW